MKPNNFDFLWNYCRKFKRGGPPNFPGVTWGYIQWSWLGAFIGFFLIAFITYRTEIPMMIGSFGASAALLYAVYQVPLAQPKNLIGGHVISGLVAVSIFQLLGKSDWTVALAVSTAITAMLVTKTPHPPGGATVLIAVDTEQSFQLVLYPVFSGALILLAVALIVNNLSSKRHYPNYWI